MRGTALGSRLPRAAAIVRSLCCCPTANWVLVKTIKQVKTSYTLYIYNRSYWLKARESWLYILLISLFYGFSHTAHMHIS